MIPEAERESDGLLSIRARLSQTTPAEETYQETGSGIPQNHSVDSALVEEKGTLLSGEYRLLDCPHREG
jgi:hypothetical protein